MLGTSLRQFVVLAMLVMLLTFSLGVVAAEFSADMTTTSDKGEVIQGKYYVKGDKIRQETEVDGETMITIMRLDLSVAWNLLSDNTYMELPTVLDFTEPQDAEYEMMKLGTETVNGYECEIIQYTYKKKSLGVLT